MGNHTMPRKHSTLTRTIAGGAAATSAVACFGLFSGGTASADTNVINGNGNTVQTSTGSNNNFGFQAGGRNRSRNTTFGNVSALNGFGNTGDVEQINAPAPAPSPLAFPSLIPSNSNTINGNGNTVQTATLSNNNVGGQFGFFGSNRSRNTTVGNLSILNGFGNDGEVTQDSGPILIN